MFADTESAKRYLVSEIVAQARRNDVPLSEIEQKMLYFSETDWTLPEISEVSAAFERDSDSVEYEHKIAELVRRHLAYVKVLHPRRTEWDQAVDVLRKGDHYLLVMIDMASAPSFRGYSPAREPNRSTGRLARLVLIGIAAFVVVALLMLVFVWGVR